MHSQDVILGHLGKTGVYAGYCFIIHLPGGGQCPLIRDSEPIRLLEIPTSPSFYMLIIIIVVVVVVVVVIVASFSLSISVNRNVTTIRSNFLMRLEARI